MTNNTPKTRKEYEVWHACDDLLSSGKAVREITGEAIAVRLRELKYKAGSTTQRYQYRDTWMAARGLSKEEYGGANPAEFNDPISRATAVFKEGLERELRREYDEKYQTLEAALFEKNVELDGLAEKYQHLQEKLSSEEQLHRDVQERYKIQSVGYQHIHEKNIGLQMRLTEIEKQLAFNQETYQKSLEYHQKQQENGMEQINKTAALLKEESDRYIAELKEMAENQRHRFIMEIDHYKTTEAALRENLARVQQENISLKGKIAETTQIIDQLLQQAHLTKNIHQKQELQDQHIRELIGAYSKDIQILHSVHECTHMTKIVLNELQQQLAMSDSCSDNNKQQLIDELV